MRGGLAVRTRTCPACDLPVPERSARWCGSCGDPLGPPPTDDRGDAGSPWPRWLLPGAGAVAAVLLVVVAGDGLVDRAAAGSTTVEDLAIEAPDRATLENLPRGPRPPAPETQEPVCSDGPRFGCFLWVQEVGPASGSGYTAIAGGHVISGPAPSAGRITAYDLHDGMPVWSAAGDTAWLDGPPFLTGDDIVLHHTGDALVARDAATGEERWTNPHLRRFSPHQVARHGEDLVLVGRQGAAPGDDPIEPGTAVVVVDAASGELGWHRSTTSATLAASGLAVALEDGRLRAYAPDGEVRWDVDAGLDDVADAGVWAMGPAVTVNGHDVGMRLHRTSDGAVLPLTGHPLAADDTHALVAEVEDLGDGGFTDGDHVVLLDESGEVWRTSELGPAMCAGPVVLGATRIEVTTCDGERFVLDRADGEVLSRTAASPGEGDGGWFGHVRLGPYDLRRPLSDSEPGGTVVVDRTTDTEVARLPPDTWPVSVPYDGRVVRDGVVVLQGAGWLTALEVPRGTPAGGDAR